MAGNGQEHLLDIAVRDGWNDNMYAFNTKSYGAQRWGFTKEYVLAGQEVNVTVTLQGENVPKETWAFRLGVSSTPDKPMELVHTSGKYEVAEAIEEKS